MRASSVIGVVLFGVIRCTRRKFGAIADRVDRYQQIVGGLNARVERHGCLLGRVVDSGGDAFEGVELLLDSCRTCGTRHARECQIDVLVWPCVDALMAAPP